MADDLQNLRKQVEDLKNEIAAHRSGSEAAGNAKNILNDISGSSRPALAPAPKPRRILRGHFGKVYALHWSDSDASEGEELVSASQDGKLIIWNAMTMNKTAAIHLRSSWVMTCAFEPTAGQIVACGGLDNLCTIYRVDGNADGSSPPQRMGAISRPHRELAAHDGYLSCCRFFDENRIITASGDSTCMLWDVNNSKVMQVFKDHSSDVMTVNINPTDANSFVTGSCDSVAMLWDVRVEGRVDAFGETDNFGHDSDINSVHFCQNGKAFASGSDDASCKLWDIRSGLIGNYWSDRTLCGITSVSMSSSGRIIFAGYDDYQCFGWDTLNTAIGSQPALTLTGHDNRVSCLGVNKNGQALCTGSWDSLLKIWA